MRKECRVEEEAGRADPEGPPGGCGRAAGSYQPVTINGQRVLAGGDVIVAADAPPIDIGIRGLHGFQSYSNAG